MKPLRFYPALLGLFLLILGPYNAEAQDDLNIHGVVSNAITSSKLDGVKVTVIKDGANHHTFSTRANGKYEFYLDCNSHYELAFEKEGFIKRSIIIDAKNVPQEIVGAGIIMPTDMSMYELTPAMEGADLSVFEQPIGKAKYDATEQDLVWDFAHTNKVKGEIFAIMRDIEKKQKELDKEASAADKAADEKAAKFAELVKSGDEALSKDKYEDAVLNYKAALDLKPGDMATEAKLGDAQTKLNNKKAAADLASAYGAALDAGDGFMRTEEFAKAIEKYNEALKLKPGEKYPTDQIAEADRILKEKAEGMAKQEQFNKLMAEGDELFKAQKFTEALAPFEAAAKVLPDNKEVQDKIKNTRDAIANKDALLAAKAKYDGLIATADESFGKKDYAKAMGSYQEASKLMPDEQYPKDKIAESEAQLAALASAAEKQAEFDEAMKAGNESLTASKYPDAIKSFENALALIPDESAAKSKLAEAQGLMAETEAKNAARDNYEKLVAEADDLLDDEQLAESKSKYEAAQKVFPDENYPIDQISKINKLMKDKADSDAAQATFEKAMVAGSGALESKQYGEAVAQFETAVDIFPKDKDATDNLDNARNLKAEYENNQALDEEYNALVASADGKMSKGELEAARKDYQAALGLKSGEKYPTTQIELIDTTIAEQADEAAEAERLAEIQKEFDGLMAAGNTALEKPDFIEAISKFESALEVKPDDSTALAKLDEAKDRQAKKNKLSELNDQYQEWITRGDAKLKENGYEDAIAAYTEASVLKPDEKYPKDQVKLIEERMAADALAKADAENAAKLEKVNALVLEGDNLVKAKTFQPGIDKYEEALGLAPDRNDIQAKIDAAANSLLSFQEAKGLEEAYNDAIADADAQMEKENWERAKASYQDALKVKPGEKYPSDKVTEIEAKLTALAAANEAERQEKLQEDFDGFIAAGDKQFSKEKYDKALPEYEDALALMPGSEVALQKIAEVNQRLGALDDAAARQNKYDNLLVEGDRLFDEASFEMAKLKFMDAAEMFPEEKYPPKKITEIELLLEQERLKEVALAEDEIDEKYKTHINDGNREMGLQNYQGAKDAFNSALGVKPDESYPKGQLERINLLIKEKEQAEQDRQRLANQQSEAEAARKKNLGKQSTVSSNSEDQAEQFMREAREAQEKERYERIKKQKQQYNDSRTAYAEGNEDLRNANYNAMEVYRQSTEKQFAEAAAAHQKKMRNSLTYKDAFLASREKRTEIDAVRRKDAYSDIEETTRNRDEWFQERSDIQNEKIKAAGELKAQQQASMQDWSRKSIKDRAEVNAELQGRAVERYSENKTANELRLERGKELKEQEAAYNEQKSERSEKNLEALREVALNNSQEQEEYQKAMLRKSDTKVDNGYDQIKQQKDQQDNALIARGKMADAQRDQAYADFKAQKSTTGAKEYGDYFRTELADGYPQGVTEESSTLGNKVIITRIVVKGNKGDEYKKVLDKAGNYYFKNGQSISEVTWNRETIDAFRKGSSDR